MLAIRQYLFNCQSIVQIQSIYYFQKSAEIESTYIGQQSKSMFNFDLYQRTIEVGLKPFTCLAYYVLVFGFAYVILEVLLIEE